MATIYATGSRLSPLNLKFLSALRFMLQSLSTPTSLHKAPLGHFLAQNPFPHPLTEGFFYREKMRAIHAIAPDRAFPRILEVGGGQGGLTALLYPRSQIVNLDCNPDYGQAACNQQPQVQFVCGDATALPFEDDSFEAITMFDVLEHIRDHKRAVAEALRVLKSGGFLLVSTPNENWKFPYYGFMRGFCPSEAEIMAAWGHVRRGYTLEELKTLIGLPCLGYATFINSLTVLGHDIAFSNLSPRWRQSLTKALSPITWSSYALHHPQRTRGTETASVWLKDESIEFINGTIE